MDPTLIERSGLSEAELRELIEIFSLVDVDHGGTISKDELATLMKTLGLRVSKVELDTMVNEIDAAGTGEIDFECRIRDELVGLPCSQGFKSLSICAGYVAQGTDVDDSGGSPKGLQDVGNQTSFNQRYVAYFNHITVLTKTIRCMMELLPWMGWLRY